MSWRWLAVLSIPFVVAALVVESLDLSMVLVLVGMLCAGIGLLVPGLADWRASRPIDAPPRKEPGRAEPPDHG